MQDISELEQIMDELRKKLIAGSNYDLIAHAIQIQRNRILSKGLLIDWNDNPNSKPYKKSAIDGVSSVTEQGFTELAHKLDDLIMK